MKLKCRTPLTWLETRQMDLCDLLWTCLYIGSLIMALTVYVNRGERYRIGYRLVELVQLSLPHSIRGDEPSLQIGTLYVLGALTDIYTHSPYWWCLLAVSRVHFISIAV